MAGLNKPQNFAKDNASRIKEGVQKSEEPVLTPNNSNQESVSELPPPFVVTSENLPPLPTFANQTSANDLAMQELARQLEEKDAQLAQTTAMLAADREMLQKTTEEMRALREAQKQSELDKAFSLDALEELGLNTIDPGDAAKLLRPVKDVLSDAVSKAQESILQEIEEKRKKEAEELAAKSVAQRKEQHVKEMNSKLLAHLTPQDITAIESSPNYRTWAITKDPNSGLTNGQLIRMAFDRGDADYIVKCYTYFKQSHTADPASMMLVNPSMNVVTTSATTTPGQGSEGQGVKEEKGKLLELVRSGQIDQNEYRRRKQKLESAA